jgi:aryl-alcohol dehydrogenase-like predicted oxidoreductase
MTVEVILPRRVIGQTGIEVSCLGLGTVKFGRNTGVKYPQHFELPDDTDVQQILHLAQELGINLIDTAPAYGSSEERLGKLLEQRHNWIICTKAGEEFEQGKSFHHFSAAHVRASLERSLQRLNTDYLDIVLVHSDGNDIDIINNTDCFAELQRCRERGLIRAFGMSTKTVAGGIAALEHSDLVMVTYNPAAAAEESVLDHAFQLNKGVLIKKALASGHIIAAPDAAQNTVGMDPVQRSMEFIFRHPAVSAVIIGTINPLHIVHNINAAAKALSSGS